MTRSTRAVLLTYAWVSLVGNLVWEVVQLPLYTLFREARPTDIAWAVLHCTVGDLLIGASVLGLSVVLVGARRWPQAHFGRVALAAIALGVGYTVFSEWFNVTVRGSWTYAPAMPRLPPLGTGLAPLLQWLAVPSVAFALARRKALNASCKRDGCREDVPRG